MIPSHLFYQIYISLFEQNEIAFICMRSNASCELIKHFFTYIILYIWVRSVTCTVQGFEILIVLVFCIHVIFELKQEKKKGY